MSEEKKTVKMLYLGLRYDAPTMYECFTTSLNTLGYVKGQDLCMYKAAKSFKPMHIGMVYSFHEGASEGSIIGSTAKQVEMFPMNKEHRYNLIRATQLAKDEKAIASACKKESLNNMLNDHLSWSRELYKNTAKSQRHILLARMIKIITG